MEAANIDNDYNHEQDKIPIFLKVLCILTFVGSGLTVLIGIVNLALFTPADAYKIIAEASPSALSELPPYDEYIKWSTYSNVVSLFAGLLGLTAAILMWKRKKTGYFLYIFSWVVPFGMSFIANEHIATESSKAFFPIMTALTFLIMGAFIVMYGLNLKHMNK